MARSISGAVRTQLPGSRNWEASHTTPQTAQHVVTLAKHQPGQAATISESLLSYDTRKEARARQAPSHTNDLCLVTPTLWNEDLLFGRIVHAPAELMMIGVGGRGGR